MLRTDALDRLGTKFEHRLTRLDIKTMMEAAGLGSFPFIEQEPFRVAAGIRR